MSAPTQKLAKFVISSVAIFVLVACAIVTFQQHRHSQHQWLIAARQQQIYGLSLMVFGYRDKHAGHFPNGLNDFCSGEYFSTPTARPFIQPGTDDYQASFNDLDWPTIASAVQQNRIKGLYHYLGSGLYGKIDPDIILLMSDEYERDGKHFLDLAMGDGKVCSIEGEDTALVLKAFRSGVNPVRYQVHVTSPGESK